MKEFHSKKPDFLMIAIVTVAVIFLISAGVFIRKILIYRSENTAFLKLADTYTKTETSTLSSSRAENSIGDSAEHQTASAEADFFVDFSSLREAAPDTVGWICINDLNISYPIMQGKDNDQYLHSYIDGSYSHSGSIFMDAGCSGFDDPYVIIYGHNMKDRSMFGNLREYSDPDFFQKTGGTFKIYTPDAAWDYQIFSVLVIAPDSDIYTLGFSSEDASGSFKDFLSRACSMSLYDTSVSVSENDHVILLSTCTGASGEKRLAVMAKRVSPKQ